MKAKATKSKRANGRPTKYEKAIQTTADRYLTDFASNGNVIPSNEGLAEYLNVNRSTLYEWRDKHPKFSDTLERIQSSQKCITLNEGLKGNFNATIAKLVLANHGMYDKQDNRVLGGYVAPVKKITEDMTAQEAADIYAEFLKETRIW